MGLSKYAQACIGFESELKESLTREDISELRKDLTIWGLNAWYEWLRKNEPETLQFVGASVSERRRKKDWQVPAVRRRLSLAGIQYVAFAHDLLMGIESHFLVSGGSYRDMAAKAGQTYFDILYSGTPLWPFDPPEPFKSGE